MNELKTLKELIKEADELSFGGYTVDTLQDEAIKWIKNDALIGQENHITPSTKYWIKHFFNLTEKDLK